MILITDPPEAKDNNYLLDASPLNDGTVNISTAEDPIEYNLKGR